jgi:hypothetical protein
VASLYSNVADLLSLKTYNTNELLGAKGPPLVGEEVHKEEVGKAEN